MIILINKVSFTISMDLPGYKDEWEDQWGNKLLLVAQRGGKLSGSYTSKNGHKSPLPIEGFWDETKPYPTISWVVKPPAPLKVRCYGGKEHWIISTKSWAVKEVNPIDTVIPATLRGSEIVSSANKDSTIINRSIVEKSEKTRLQGNWLEIRSIDKASTNDDHILTGCVLFTYMGNE